jgi:hypothetical protein
MSAAARRIAIVGDGLGGRSRPIVGLITFRNPQGERMPTKLELARSRAFGAKRREKDRAQAPAPSISFDEPCMCIS